MNVSYVMRNFAKRHSLPPRLEGPEFERAESCSFCGSKRALRLARMDYWDLSEHDLAQCIECGLMQIDPMLTTDNLKLGCQAYYRFEKLNHGLREIQRTCLRNFRKGVCLGMDLLKRGLKPDRSLELGAGDAYYSRGLKFVFPNLEAVCLEVVPEVLLEIRRHHGFQTVSQPPEKLTPQDVGHFDLVIGRDILEHVRDPNVVLANIHACLRPGGIFHFITPNGHEDVWYTHGHWRLHQQATEHLINHVSFFPSATLRAKLESIGFAIDQWILFDFKGTFRESNGRRFDKKYLERLARPSRKRKASAEFAKTAEQSRVDLSSIDPHSILKAPWLKSRKVAQVYCHLRHKPRWYCDGNIGIGHEIYGLVRKQMRSANSSEV